MMNTRKFIIISSALVGIIACILMGMSIAKGTVTVFNYVCSTLIIICQALEIIMCEKGNKDE